MKYLSSLLVLLFVLVTSTTSVYADFFGEYVMGDDPEIVMLEDITLTYVNLRDAKEIARFNNTSSFVSSIKEEAMNRYSNGTIPLYRMHDIITNLDSFVYIMNQHFFYQKRYEQTKKSVYKDSANSYLEDARWAYSRLRDTLKNSAK